MTKKQKAAAVVERLKLRYPNAMCSLDYHHDKPYELLIATRLSAQCTDARVNIVTQNLFSKYKTLEAFAAADLSDMEAMVKSCGFYKVKANDIIKMTNSLISDYGGVLPDTVEELTKLSGVGRKTANLIVGDIYHKPAIVTDTHCIRICFRLGLTSSDKDPKKTEDELRLILDPAESNSFCHRIVMFGRDVCKSQSPKCELCEMQGICSLKK